MGNPSVEWLSAINALAAAYRVELSEPQLDAYWLATDDLTLERVQGAVRKAIRECGEFMPSPGELRVLAGVPKRPYHQPWKEPDWMLADKPAWPLLAEATKPKGA